MVKGRPGLWNDSLAYVGMVGAQRWRGPTFKGTTMEDMASERMAVDHHLAF